MRPSVGEPDAGSDVRNGHRGQQTVRPRLEDARSRDKAASGCCSNLAAAYSRNVVDGDTINPHIGRNRAASPAAQRQGDLPVEVRSGDEA
jgi:hypothetical protein